METSIVCVHGRAQKWQLEDAVQREWRDAIRAGIKRSKTDDPLVLSDDRIILAFYGDLFRPDAEGRRKDPLVQDAAFEEDLANAFIQEAVNRGQIHRAIMEKALFQETKDTAEKGLIAASTPFLRFLDRLPGLSNFLLRGFVQDVDQYLHTSDFRKRVIDQVAIQLRRQQQLGREVILVAHSLGTVVAYDLLHTHPDITVSSFITLGSPLGIQGYIYRSLLPIGKQPSFPSNIKGNWSNFYDANDIVALVPELAPLFPSTSEKMIKSIIVFNRPNDHHSSSDYLSSKKVGLALRTALQY